jgi:aquaporin Z
MEPRRLLAEAVGTFVLVGVGSMTIVAANSMGAPILATVPFGFGLALLAGIYAFGHVSGAHFNPAVTIAMVIDKRTAGVEAVGFIVVQLIGAIAASALLLALSGTDAVISTTSAPGPALGASSGASGTLISDAAVAAAVVEITLTAIFLFVILTVTKRAGGKAGIVIALTLAAAHFAGIPFSGSSLNPARSLGPAIVSGSYDDIWVYIVGPIVGGIIGWAIYWAVQQREEAAPATA